MIYEFMRFMAGPYLNSAVDYYIANQVIFNLIVVALGFAWILYKNAAKQHSVDN